MLQFQNYFKVRLLIWPFYKVHLLSFTLNTKVAFYLIYIIFASIP